MDSINYQTINFLILYDTLATIQRHREHSVVRYCKYQENRMSFEVLIERMKELLRRVRLLE